MLSEASSIFSGNALFQNRCISPRAQFSGRQFFHVVSSRSEQILATHSRSRCWYGNWSRSASCSSIYDPSPSLEQAAIHGYGNRLNGYNSSNLSNASSFNILSLVGSSFGGIVYPIMLNQLFKGSAGFAWGVRASAFLTMFLLLVANCIMRTRPLRADGSSGTKVAPDPKADVLKALRDVPYMVCMTW